MFQLEIDTDNAAFDTFNLEFEVARLLRASAHAFYNGKRQGSLLDSNGNAVGKFEYVSDEGEE